MIKLIASDLDGTLLPESKKIPRDFFDVLDEVLARKIVFAVASGRTYTAVDHLFPQMYLDKIAFICDNGACVYRGGKVVHTDALDEQTYFEFIEACEQIGGLNLVACASEGVYHLRSSDDFSDEVGRYYRNHKVIDNFRNVRDTVYKLAVCDATGAEEHGKPALDKIFKGRLNIQVSGKIWMDVMAAGVSKGTALASLQKQLGVSHDETMAFGDYFNDVEMLGMAKWSFCPKNGHEDVKKLCGFICEDCEHGGVTKAIKQYALSNAV